MSENQAIIPGEPHRTQPLGLIVYAIAILRQLIIPLIAGSVAIRDELSGIGILGLILLLVVSLVLGIAYLSWRRRTFTVGEEDIRLESGIISRSAASVPYERIQDVSLEQALIPRILGLVSVKFETGAGGAEELKLAYLDEAQGEYLRELVRERRDGEVNLAALDGAGERADEGAVLAEEPAETLFAMGPTRLFTFGMFEFSLAAVAVLFGLTQTFSDILPFDIWEPDFWLEAFAGQREQIENLSMAARVFGGLVAMLSLVLLGFVTGILRTFIREWGFLLERTSRGFRRRRGLFTRTDVVMPKHRVQAIKLGTRVLRYRFGWHGLKFVSLASDFAGSSHVVAPFAKRSEIDPIIRSAGFEPPRDDLDWRRASKQSRFDAMVVDALIFGLIAIPVGIFAPTGFVAIPIALGVIAVCAEFYSWRFHRHAVDADYIYSTKGLLSPSTEVGSKTKLHSVEISQGPIAQYRGYATLNLGLAGGNFAIPGIPIETARELRAQISQSIVKTDFSQINRG